MIWKKYMSQVLVACAYYNPSYLGDWDLEDHSSKPAWANSSWDPAPHLKNNHSKMDWRYCSRDRAPALQNLNLKVNSINYLLIRKQTVKFFHLLQIF
jgi:hypothetical protein